MDFYWTPLLADKMNKGKQLSSCLSHILLLKISSVKVGTRPGGHGGHAGFANKKAVLAAGSVRCTNKGQAAADDCFHQHLSTI